MTIVQVVKDWNWPDLMRQSPGRRGIWQGVQFSLERLEQTDYALVLNKPAQDTLVRCPPQHVWALMQEPPNEMFGTMHRGDPSYARIYTNDDRLRGDRYIHSQPALAWYVNRDYDELLSCGIPEKDRALSWITSSQTVFKGHRQRMKFLKRIQSQVAFDLYGRGFAPIADKWDGLAPYRYSLAIENFQNPYYWSEKLADCFLAWTMPIYCGCTRIGDYFPPESMVSIDILDPQVGEKIRAVLASRAWERNLDAIAEARSRVLERYQLFPWMAGEIERHEREHIVRVCRPEPILLPANLRVPLTPVDHLRRLWRRVVSRSLREKLARLRQYFE
jgi:hypothetical protein